MKLLTLKFLCSSAGDDRNIKPGDVVQIPEPEALRQIKNGNAVLVEDVKPIPCKHCGKLESDPVEEKPAVETATSKPGETTTPPKPETTTTPEGEQRAPRAKGSTQR